MRARFYTLLFLAVFTPFFASAAVPGGYFDQITSTGIARGWTVDSDTTSTSLTVQFYMDGPIGSGTLAGQTTANTSRPDVDPAVNHGFLWQIPSQYLSAAHTWYAYSLDSSTQTPSLLTNSHTNPVIAPPTNQPPGGFLDLAAPAYATGWALDLDVPTQSIMVQFYLDGPKGTGTLLGTTPTSILRPDVNQSGNVSGHHGFAFTYPASIASGPHTIYAYGIDSAGGADALLGNSPMSFTFQAPFIASPGPQPIKLAGSTVNGYGYAYGPSTINVDGPWHMYYCSGGGNPGWDDIRHATSQDLAHWSVPDIVIVTSDMTNERASCDPSVVQFNAGDGAYYYLFYSGNQLNTQTVNFVARSQSPYGPFLKYTNRGTWELNPADPKIILSPLRGVPDSVPGWYGLGQPSVVVKDGTLYQWYTDDTAAYPNGEGHKIYLSTSKDPKNWAQGQPTNVANLSVDVKYDAQIGKFIMFELIDEHGANSRLAIRTSSGGITWSDPTTILAVGNLPPFSNNVGVSGSRTGELMRSSVFVGYGAPYGLVNNSSWGAWDLYGQQISSSLLPTPSTCTPNWSCSVWNQCSASLQSRTCTDTNACGVSTGKPAESQSCTMSSGGGGAGGGGGSGGGGTVPPVTSTSTAATSTSPATSTTQTTAQKIAALLAQIQQLQALLAKLKGGSTIVSTPPQPQAAVTYNGKCPVISRTLSRGMKGADVAALQKFLTTQYKDFTSKYMTGSFGPITEAALKQWQREHAIQTTGMVGPKTRAAIGACK